MLHTTIPTRPRVEVITYTVQAGDTVFGIAELFGLRPETIFWGNQEVLGDDPHRLFPDQVLNILPIDGVYHEWSTGEDLVRVAEFYGVESMSILEWPGNHLDLLDLNISQPDITAGTWLIVPGGHREFVDFGPPRITRDNPAIARTYGPGHCGEIADGAVGTGAFMWPTTERWISGYNFNPAANHSGIDIAGELGNPIWAADAGVVVYSGWSYLGYGNLVVIDHGQWQTVYAHLSDYYVTCGMSVFQGATIGLMGSTGNSSGPHLHFELMYQSAKVNPLDYISP
jgi:murein DD-endopeptidase MepM/ murein hydrolase activator NlpD